MANKATKSVAERLYYSITTLLAERAGRRQNLNHIIKSGVASDSDVRALSRGLDKLDSVILETLSGELANIETEGLITIHE